MQRAAIPVVVWIEVRNGRLIGQPSSGMGRQRLENLGLLSGGRSVARERDRATYPSAA